MPQTPSTLFQAPVGPPATRAQTIIHDVPNVVDARNINSYGAPQQVQQQQPIQQQTIVSVSIHIYMNTFWDGNVSKIS